LTVNVDAAIMASLPCATEVAMGTYHKVAKAKDVAPGCCAAVEVGAKPIALFNVDGTFYAIGGTCTHEDGPLAEGLFEGTTVTCPWHGATFDVCTGESRTPPAYEDVPCYRVRVVGEDVEVEIP
jgi:nitrite reductase/ring-hydroxylating ferredoxin subunit